jgi:sarcosine oxidase
MTARTFQSFSGGYAGPVHATRYNTIVIGMGGMGSAAAYHLARRGQRVLGLEQYDVPHDQGSSHGYTRIIRMAYYEHPSYVMLLRRAYELWREIEERSGEQLLHITGSIDAGAADSWVFKGALQAAMEHELEHEVLTGLEMAEQFPGYRLPPELLGLWQPDGGFLAPERCIVAYVFEAMRLGAEIHGRERVLRWEPLGDEGVRVYTDRDVYEADSLVITAGAWNDDMLDFLAGLAVPERQVLAWFQPQRPEHFQQDNFPVFNLITDEGRFYGFPIHGVPGFKIGRYHHFEESGPASEIDFEVYPEDEAMLRDVTSRYFPDGVGPTMTLKACMFVNSPDGHFLLDLHPRYPQVSYASACSGHGFKFASVIGEILADLAIHRQTRHGIDLFSHERFLGSGVAGETAVRRHARAGRGAVMPGAEESRTAGERRSHGSGHRTHPLHPARGTRRLASDARLAIRPERDLPVPTYASSESERRRAEQDWKVWSPWG